jgi:hypothetical protein
LGKSGLATYDALEGIDWEWLAMAGAMTKAPLGGKKVGKNPTDRGKSGPKRSLLTDGGVPIGLAVAGANRHDCKLVTETLTSLPIARPAPASEQPQGLCLDQAYDYDEVHAILHEFGFTAHLRAAGRKRGPSPRKPAIGRGAGWWSGRIAGCTASGGCGSSETRKSRTTWRFCIWHVPI